MRVTLANVTVHHSYEAARALEEIQALDRFVTSVYRLPGRVGTRVLDRLLASHPADVERFRRRHAAGLPDERVTSVAWPELIEWGWHRTPAAGRLVDPNTITYLRNEAFDRSVALRHVGHPEVFHGFEQCSEHSFRTARRRGAVTVLDMPIMHRRGWDRAETEERANMGLGPAVRAPLFDHHIQRKFREIDLASYLLVGLDFVRRSFVAEGFPEDRIFTVPYGVDPSTFTPVDRDPGRGRSEGFRILYVGQTSWVKGLHRFMDVFDRLDIPGVELVVAGLIHDEWADYFRRRFAAAAHPVRVLGTVPRAEIADLMRESDVLVFPSLVGGIGVAVYEAMATGLPVVTSDADVVIRDGEDGFGVPIDDQAAWVRTLQELAADPSLRERIGSAARDRVGEFTWERYRSRLQDAYREIAQREGLT